jgi:hypothetical protein
VAGLFPPQKREWALPAEVPLTPRAAERLSREASVQAFEPAARALEKDWGMPLDGKQVQRWSQAIGQSLVRRRHKEVRAYEQGQRPEPPPNAPQVLVIGFDGGRYQGMEKNPLTGSYWRENKVLAASTYLRGDGGEQAPQLLVTTMLATAGDAETFGFLARLEAERRGVRTAEEVIGMGDGGNWLDPQFEKHFRLTARIIDWCHANEHLWDCAKAIHPDEAVRAAVLAEHWEAMLWDGRVGEVIACLAEESGKLGEPREQDGPEHPRRVLAQNVGYFSKHKEHMNYPAYRRRGWPIGSGVTEAAVKQFNKRVKGTEQFWGQAGVEAIMALRGMWISQDQRWDKHWATRSAYVN